MIAFVSQDNLFGVSLEMLKFLDQGETFLKYKRPPTKLNEQNFSESTISKTEAIRRHSLMSTIYEDDARELLLPFNHSAEDKLQQKKWELSYLEDISMVSTFGDIDNLGVQFDLEKDFIP